MRSLANALESATPVMLKKYGVNHVRLIVNWSKVVDSDMLSFSYPQKISYSQGHKVLYIAVSSSGILLRMQHSTHIILDKVNRFFGYKAVDSVRVVKC